MRVLATVNGSPSHCRALLQVVRPLLNAGHEVLVGTSEQLSALLEREGVRTAAVLVDPQERTRQQLRALLAAGVAMPEPAPEESPELTQQHLARMVRMPIWAAGATALLAVCADFRPDLVLRDDTEFSGYLAAEVLGVPHVAITAGFTNTVDPALLPDPLVAQWDALGIAGAPPEGGLYRYGRIDFLPAELSFAARLQPGLAYRQPVLTRAGESLPGWMADLPADRPLVLASLGTVLPLMHEFEHASLPIPGLFRPTEALRAIVTALSEVDCTAIVVTNGIDLGDTTASAHVHLVDQAPQPLVLECAQLFVTHAGYNSVRESMRSGVPMVAHPGVGDQQHNARRLAELGLGQMVAEPDAELLAAACTSVLADQTVAARVRAAQRSILALPPVRTVVDDLEKIAAA